MALSFTDFLGSNPIIANQITAVAPGNIYGDALGILPATVPGTTPGTTLVSVALSGPTSVNEGANAYYSVILGVAAPAGGVSIPYYLSDGTAVSGVDFTGSPSGTITVAAGATTGTMTIPVKILADNLTEGPETFSVSLGTLPTGYGYYSTMITTTVNDTSLAPNTPPTITGNTAVTNAMAGTPADLPDVVFADDGASVTLTVTSTNGTVTGFTSPMTGTPADVTAAFAAATFTGTTAGAGTVGLSLSDGVNTAVTGSIPVTVTAANAAPTITGVVPVTNAVIATAVALPDVVFGDTDSPTLTVTVTPVNGTITGFTSPMTDTIANINTAFAAATFTGRAAGAGSVGLSVSDLSLIHI